jgi:hypothetical protein
MKMPQSRPRSKLDASVLAELRMLASELPIGASSNGRLCPFCRGGRTSERSFSITAMDGSRAGYCCHRASCGAHGFVDGAAHSFSRVSEFPKSERPRPYVAEVHGLGDYWLHKLSDSFGFSESQVSELGWTEEAGSGRLVVYIRDPSGKRRGIHTRAREGQYPKTRDYREENSEWMGWFFHHEHGRERSQAIILVEDVFSAAKGSYAGFTTASLQGSHLSLDQMLEAESVAAGRRIILALDRDATDKAQKIVSRYSFLSGGNLIQMQLSKDLKYHTTEEIKQMVNDIAPIPQD